MSEASAVAAPPPSSRWLQLVFGVLCMVMIANLQYGWTLFVGPIDQKFHWGKTAIQVAFTIFVLTETWLVPFEGYLIDRFGPRIVVLGGGLLVGIAWVMNSFAASLTALYTAAAIGGTARARSTEPRWGTRSSGSPTAAAWLPGSPPWVSARAPCSP